jgi:uncharacterized protein YqfA (UPF0365 family)
VVIAIVRRCSNFFNDPSVVSLVTTMASATRAQVVAKEGEANSKALEADNKVVVAEVPKATPTWMEKALSLVLHKGNMEGTNSQVTFAPPLLTSVVA